MNRADRTRVLGIAAVAAGLLAMGSASAWYGSPWYRPFGAGAMTYERQTMMRRHGYVMQELTDMFEGRRAFDRAEAVRLARELEGGLGDALASNFAPDSVVAGSRAMPWIWDNFGAFRGYAEAARQSSARLAEALDREPTAEEMQQKGAWIASRTPRPRAMGFSPRRHRLEGLISMDAIHEYSRLNATCHSCHMTFRGWRY